jgi:hypothetical protein
VIILFSDGEATSSANMAGNVTAGGKTLPSTTLCEQAVNEATAIKRYGLEPSLPGNSWRSHEIPADTQ